MKIVKKLLPVLVMCAALTACGNNTITKENLMAVNTLQTLFDRHQTMNVNTTYYDIKNDSEYKIYSAISLGEDGCMTIYEDSSGHMEYQEGDYVYISEPADNSFSVVKFPDGQLQSYVRNLEKNNLQLWQDNEVVESIVSGSVGTLTTEIPVEKSLAYLNNNIDKEDYDTVRHIYTYDPETLEIESYSEVGYSKDNQDILVKSAMSYSDETIKAPEFVEDLKQLQR